MTQSFAQAEGSLEALADAMARRDIKSNRLRLLLRMAVAVRGGMTTADFLSALAETEAENGRYANSRVYKEFEARLRSGEYGTHEALHEVTTVDDRVFLVAERKVQDLSVLLQMAYDTAEKKQVIVRSVFKPFALPMYLFVMACGLLVLGGTVMLPNFVQMFPVSQWEAPSRAVFNAGQYLRQYWLPIVAVIGALVWLVVWSLGNYFSPLRTRYLDRVFPWSLYKSLQSSAFLLALAALFKAKVPVLEAVRSYEQVASPYGAGYARLMLERLESEQVRSDMVALDVGFIDRSTMDSMRILTNKLPADEVIQKIGDAEFSLLADEVAQNSQRMSRVVAVLVAAFLLFTLYGTMSVIPSFTEKVMANQGQGR